jgi:hypothetical protein
MRKQFVRERPLHSDVSVMASKPLLVEHAAADGLLLPELLNRGLAATERLEYYLALLQAAIAHARRPGAPTSSLRTERESSGVDDASFDEIVTGSRSLTPELYLIPGAARVLERIVADLRETVAPLLVAGAGNAELHERLDAYQRRIDERIAHMPRCDDDRVPSRTVEELTRRTTNGHDSTRQLVLDLRWELNRLQGRLALEIIDGARGHNLTEGDRPLLRAFMKGVRDTLHLTFDYRAFTTTATRTGHRLSIQNELGAADKQVVVIQITGLTATVIYTDVHRSRAAFLQQLLERDTVHWETQSETSSERQMSVGRWTAETPQHLEKYLTFLGSRLVFLIECRRARKRLARFVKRTDATMLLKWAAENDVGHCAFLQAGDIHLIQTALERAVPGQARVGVRLDELLGRDSACAFLKTVLATTSAGLTSRRSSQLINDEIEAELLTYLETGEQTALGAAAEQANVLSAMSDGLRTALLELKNGGARGGAARISTNAKSLQIRAGEFVTRFDHGFEATHDGHGLRRLLARAGRVADVLERTAFELTLVPDHVETGTIELLDDLADLLDQSARAYARSVQEARDLRGASTRRDLERVLVSVDQLGDLIGRAASVQRDLEAALTLRSTDFRQMHVLSTVGRAFERAVRALAECGVVVRDYALNARWATK